MPKKDNGELLRELIETCCLTQAGALGRFNQDQARPISLSQWKGYLAHTGSARRSPCPDRVLIRAQELFIPEQSMKVS